MNEAYGNGILYAVLFSNGYVKIGITRNVENRIKMIASHSPLEMIRIVCVPTGPHLRRVESELHELFKEHRLHGEFFMFDWQDWISFFTFFNKLDWANDNGLTEDLVQFYTSTSKMI